MSVDPLRAVQELSNEEGPLGPPRSHAVVFDPAATLTDPRSGPAKADAPGITFAAAQAYFAKFILAALAGSIVVVGLLYVTKRWTGLDSGDVRDFGAMVLGPLLTLTASVIGFYFGERNRS